MTFQKKIGWFLLTGALVVGLFGLVLNFFPQISARLPPGRIRIAVDTTFITEPIDREGYPDYEEWLNRKLSEGVDPKQNRIVALLTVTGRKVFQGEPAPDRFYRWLGVDPPPEGGDYLISLADFLKLDPSLSAEKKLEILNDQFDICLKRPWKKEEYPQIAAWIEHNRKPLDAAMVASAKPHYFHPVIDPNKGTGGSGIVDAKSMFRYLPRDVVSLLCCRALLEAGQKGVNQKGAAGVKQTLLSCYRFQRSFKPSFLMDLLMLASSEGIMHAVLPVVLENASFSLEELRSLTKEIEVLGPLPSLMDLFNECERALLLDLAISVGRTGEIKKGFSTIASRLEEKNESRNRIFKRSFDVKIINHNEVLTTINKWFNRCVVELKIADPQLRREGLERTRRLVSEQSRYAMERLDIEGESWLPGSLSSRTTTAAVGLELASMAVGLMPLIQSNLDRMEQKRRLFLISLALAQYKLKTGQYPESLAAIVPIYLQTIPLDIFTGNLPVYNKTPEGGYLLYSFGPDQVDSKGRTREEDRNSDDILIKVPLPAKK